MVNINISKNFFSEKKTSFVESDSPQSEQKTRPRCKTYTIYQTKQPAREFFTDLNGDTPILQQKYQRQQQQQQRRCEDCLRRNRLIELQREDLLRLYNQNKRLNHQLGSAVLKNRQHENEIEKLKEHLSEYQRTLRDLKQKMSSETKPDEEQEQDEEILTMDHLKRLRNEIQMYNRLVAAKDKSEQNELDSFF